MPDVLGIVLFNIFMNYLAEDITKYNCLIIVNQSGKEEG